MTFLSVINTLYFQIMPLCGIRVITWRCPTLGLVNPEKSLLKSSPWNKNRWCRAHNHQHWGYSATSHFNSTPTILLAPLNLETHRLDLPSTRCTHGAFSLGGWGVFTPPTASCAPYAIIYALKCVINRQSDKKKTKGPCFGTAEANAGDHECFSNLVGSWWWFNISVRAQD